MKILFLILSLISFNAFAGYVAESKINSCQRTDYSSLVFCIAGENEPCFKTPEETLGECGIYKFRDVYGGPHKSVDECSGQANCQSVLIQKQCLSNQEAFINENYSFVYCMDIVGKELVVDSSLKTTKDAANMVKKIDDALEENALLRMRCGQLVIAKLLVRNSGKQLTVQQVEQLSQTYSPIQGLLLNGSLETAKSLIQAVVPDGFVVTDTDKVALIEKLDSCKPL